MSREDRQGSDLGQARYHATAEKGLGGPGLTTVLAEPHLRDQLHNYNPLGTFAGRGLREKACAHGRRETEAEKQGKKVMIGKNDPVILDPPWDPGERTFSAPSRPTHGEPAVWKKPTL